MTARAAEFGAGGMKALERADRGEHDRKAELAVELGHGGVDLAHVAQHPRPERDGIERHAVPAQRSLGLGAADDVVPVVLVQVLPRLGDDLVQVEQVAGGRGGVMDGWRFGRLGIAFLHVGPGRVGGRGEERCEPIMMLTPASGRQPVSELASLGSLRSSWATRGGKR